MTRLMQPSGAASCRHRHHVAHHHRSLVPHPPHWPLVAVAARRRRCRHRGAAPPSASAAASASPPSPAPPLPTTTNQIRIRLATPQDYWQASDLHCAAFFEQETPHQRTRRLNLGVPRPPGPQTSPRGALAAREARWTPCALRVDRCVSLQLNDDLQRRGVGRTALLLAEMEFEDEEEAAVAMAAEAEAAAAAAAPTDPLAFPRPLFFLSRLLQPPVRAGLDAAIEKAAGPPPPQQKVSVVVGTATVDSFGDLVPPKQLDPGRDGAFGWTPRHGGDRNHYAYVSNVAVAPFVRRRGVARRLVRAAERLAAGWGGGGRSDDDDCEDLLVVDAADASDPAADPNDTTSTPPAWACGAAALHCSPDNAAALALYGAMGYRRVALEPAWAPYLNGRGSGGRCYLMVRRLPTTTTTRRRRREAE